MIPIRDWIYLGIIVVGLTGGTIAWQVHNSHERALGRAQIEQSDLAARGVLRAQVKADEEILQAAADKAATERKGVQDDLDQYVRDHPTGPVRLCRSAAHDSGTGLPKGGGVGTSATDSGTGPDVVPEVPGRDISGDFDTLVLAAATVDGLYQSCQKLK